MFLTLVSTKNIHQTNIYLLIYILNFNLFELSKYSFKEKLKLINNNKKKKTINYIKYLLLMVYSM